MTITITQVRNAASLQADNLRMDVEINHPQHGWIPYTLDHSDTDNTINNKAVIALVGANFAAYVPPTPPTQEELDTQLAAQERSVRNEKLSTEIDPIVTNPLRWDDLTISGQSDMAIYRKELLDVPQQAGFPNTHKWPTKPGAV